MIASIRDVIQPKKIAKALQETKERYRHLLESTSAIPWEADVKTWVFTYIGPQAAKLLGYPLEHWLEEDFWVNHLHPEDRKWAIDYCLKATAQRDNYEFEYRMIAADGRSVWLHDIVNVVRQNGEPVTLRGFMIDITERKRVEEALRAREARLSELQTELLNVSRQSAMGELSSALAHELNQPLAAIMNYIQASRRMMKKGTGSVSEKTYEMMDKALDQADRAGAIMRGLRDIVEKGEAARAASDINKVVEEASALGLIGAARAGIRLDLELGDDLPPVNINEIQIQQVVMNLVRNGVEAMAASEKRDLTIKTALDHEDAVEIAIGDTGPGLAEEVEERLFQPFVTTKAGGMGIGLSISHSIVEAHGGRLWATPAPDGGTVFHFTLPLAPDGAEDNDE